MGAADRYRDEPDDEAQASSAPLPRYRDDPSSEDEDTLLPGSPGRGAQEEPATPPKWHWNSKAVLPPRLTRYWEATKTWVRGPQPPRIYKITPIFPAVQHAPLRLLDRYCKPRLARFTLLIFAYALWILAFSLVQWKSSFAGEVKGHGSPMRLSCFTRMWGDGNGCGINGDQCRPFTNSTMAFRCPSDCSNGEVYEPHVIGDYWIRYKNIVVGGPTDPKDPIGTGTYRGDSFICGAAVHAGFVSDVQGGCGVMELVGEQGPFPASKAHNIDSYGFDSYFPLSFRFKPGTAQQCRDLRWQVLAVSATATALISIFTTSPGVFFFSSWTMLYWTVALATDPPVVTDNWSLISIGLGKFLPATFCMAIMYLFVVRRSMTGLTAQFERTVLWLGPAWISSMNNFTFIKIPIHRLTPRDIRSQPGGVIAIIIIATTIFAIALGQAWAFRIEGRMPRYLALYAGMSATLLILIPFPPLNIRIHHYILGLLLLPGTSFQNRRSLIYQGLLVGFFVHGTARWGFAPLLETPGALFGGENMGSLLPAIAPPAIGALANNITFTLGPLPGKPDHGRVYDGISVLVNDVERLRTYADYDDPAGGPNWVNGSREWTWERRRQGVPEYFRFAYMQGGGAVDYTQAGTWLANGSWVHMKPGPSG